MPFGMYAFVYLRNEPWHVCKTEVSSHGRLVYIYLDSLCT